MRGRTKARARLVAAELEQRWNALARGAGARRRAGGVGGKRRIPLTQLERLLELGADVSAALLRFRGFDRRPVGAC